MKKILPIIFILLLFSGCIQQNKPFTAEYFDVLDTYCTVTIYDTDKETFETIKKELHSELQRYDELFNIYKDFDGVNNIKTINDNAGIAPVEVDDDIINILKNCKNYYDVSNGKVNVAMGAVLSIWHDYREKALDGDSKIPSQEELTNAEKHIDINTLEIDEEKHTVYLTDEYSSLDLGAVAKGFIADKTKEFLTEKGIESAIVSLGGNVIVIGTPPNKESWIVGVQNPDTESSSYVATLEVKSGSAVTSGDYQRYYEYEGKRYCHIIDSDTLYPAEYFRSVTVMCENSELADAMSTALFASDLESGKEIAKKMNLKVMWLFRDGSIETNY